MTRITDTRPAGPEAPEIVWTAKEALACALCWANFSHPEEHGFGTPSQYWLGIDESARQYYRKAAKDCALLAVARGQYTAIPPSASLTKSQIMAIGEAAGLKMTNRILRVVDAVRGALHPIKEADHG